MFQYSDMFDYAGVAEACTKCAESGDLSPFPKETPVAMAYVPFQQFGNVYNSAEGLKNGTMFPELNKPFLGKAACS